MRSRYSAFARGDAAYLMRTSDLVTRMKLRPGDFRAAFLLTWTRLEIVATAGGGPDDQEGVVRFRAHYRGPAGDGVLDETSRFRREGGAWVYRDGRGHLP